MSIVREIEWSPLLTAFLGGCSEDGHEVEVTLPATVDGGSLFEPTHIEWTEQHEPRTVEELLDWWEACVERGHVRAAFTLAGEIVSDPAASSTKFERLGPAEAVMTLLIGPLEQPTEFDGEVILIAGVLAARMREPDSAAGPYRIVGHLQWPIEIHFSEETVGVPESDV